MSKNMSSELEVGPKPYLRNRAAAGVRFGHACRKIGSLYDTLGQALVDGLVVSDCNHCIVYANARFCQGIGYSLDEIQGRPVADLLDIASKPLLAKQIDKALTPDCFKIDLNWNGKEGDKVASRVSPVLIESIQSSEVIFFVVRYSGDQFEHEHLLNSPSESDTMKQSCLQASFIEQGGKIIASNGPIAEILGSDTEGQGNAILLAQLMAKTNGLNEPLRLTKKDGKDGWVQLSYSQIDYAGKTACLGNIVDVTSHRQLQHRAREAQFKQISLLDKLDSSHEIERKRISNDLHDGVGPYLTALKFQLERLIDDSTSHDRSSDRLAEMVPIIQSAIEQMRRCIMALRPPLLDDLGLVATLKNVAHEFESMYAIQVESKFDIDEHWMNDQLSTIIYRLVQESLNNIAKHAQAEGTVILLEQREGSLQLSIKDNGKGFSLAEYYGRTRSTSSSGLGLYVMKERVELSGGCFSISSESGSGTIISAIWNNLEMATDA